MALVTLVGYPCSGKSTLASKLKIEFEARLSDSSYSGPKLSVVIISDESCHVPRTVYDDSKSEKSGRATLFASLTRALGPNTIVICDSLNYIKGFRYQMYCSAREAHARVCTVHIATPAEQCVKWHERRGECSYVPSTFENLIMRFEEPSSMVRWDSPLYLILPSDPIPFSSIFETITKGFKAPPTAAVKRNAAPPPNTMQVLSGTTSHIISTLLTHLNAIPTSTSFSIPSPPSSPDTNLVLHLPMRRVLLPDNGMAAGNWSENEVASAFVKFLEIQWDTVQ
ncbi:hypothetical protein TREMEDRAFT_24439 [Tremella mesenterica DSM 1558]|uniref:uncharacterized protein n=1 Tax=Tremella mesenterica (strain ATCC 24925 / CBS 8224 / DSM 1558 / NBRC 9311 / NRRL Y-6157 / RJB 2259-6 / UBC 559-6) TaxID=578456 RepID=UPI0003F49CCF|nr:uncharacterized protein TREMEDRAFT_24439 [Tremella mesenterica DSM 1558]EIW73277.1 hypothetical protein TREMEDRAFT_24439 [Tremella mesenterica DSM 1558]